MQLIHTNACMVLIIKVYLPSVNRTLIRIRYIIVPDNKVRVASMGPTWVLSAPGGPRVGPMSLAIGGFVDSWCHTNSSSCRQHAGVFLLVHMTC